mmetsp:Transcript_32861/g.72587  ORF Transcript_32861/g.72587 Transcript_32861/m.72587 type:complete len:217 (+) Transcript_32861:1810-2460(+)
MSRQSRFWAEAVRKSEEEWIPVWNWDWVRKLPIFLRESSPALLPAADDNDLMMGMKIPPARAEVEGMAGARTHSATLRPRVRPSVLLPMAWTKMFAMRSPSPVFSKPLAKKNETTMSQMTSLVMAEKACAKVRVLVTRVTVTAMKAQAPTGRGSRINPKIVDAKMASNDQPCSEMPAGMGIKNRIASPTAIACNAGTIFTPVGPVAGAGAAGVSTA